MILQNKRIAIIGAGPGGLTLARLLQNAGLNVTVYERDKDRTVRQQGATLDLHEDSGLKAIKEAGLMNEFKMYYRPGADRMRITDCLGNIKFDDHESNMGERFGDEHFRPEIDRGPLRDMLIESIAPDTIIWNAKFSHMEKSESGWDLYFEDHFKAFANIVIAADGANSRIRKYITGIRPIYSGITIVEGNIYNAGINAPKLWELTKGGKVFALGGSKTIILSAKGDGSISFYTGTKENEDWVNTSGIDFNNKGQIADWFKDRFSSWSEIWQEAFAGNEAWFIPRPQYYFPLDQSWETQPDITMIGDAAHRMPPYTGEGVNQAMLDALELYEALCKDSHHTIHEAIDSFENKMFRRTSEITCITLQQTEAMHAENNLEYIHGFFSEALK